MIESQRRYHKYLYNKIEDEKNRIYRLPSICWEMSFYGAFKFKMTEIKRIPKVAWEEIDYKLNRIDRNITFGSMMFINTKLEIIDPPFEICLGSVDNMFAFSQKLKHINMSGFKFIPTEQKNFVVTNSMFRGSLVPEGVDFSGLRIQEMTNMFMNCLNEELDISTLDISDVCVMSGTFAEIQKLKRIIFKQPTRIHTERKLVTMDRTFCDCESLLMGPNFLIDFLGPNSEITTSTLMLHGCRRVKNIKLYGLLDERFQYQQGTFSKSGIVYLELEGFYLKGHSSFDIVTDCECLVHVIGYSNFEHYGINLSTNKSLIV